MDTIKSDIFQREKIAEAMCKFIVETPSHLISPIVLDGAWGCGKTEHAKRMRRCFRNKHGEKVKCVYWNAAASDFASEPLPMFAAVLYDSIESEKIKEVFSKSALDLCVGAFFGAARSLFCQVLNSKTGIDITQALEEGKRGASAMGAQSELESQFTTFLGKASEEKVRIKAACALIDLAKSDTQELVIIIDELDRCRPDFALRMIECIKHLFDEADCKFVLVMNKMSMHRSIGHLYGLDNEDAEVYLSKYIKTDFQLPRNVSYAQHQDVELCSVRYFYSLLKETGVKLPCGGGILKQFVELIINRKNLQLREVEKWVQKIKFMQSSIPENRVPYQNALLECLICFLAYLLTFERDLANQILSREADCSAVLRVIDASPSSQNTIIIRVPDCVKYIRCVWEYYFAKNWQEKERISKKLDGMYDCGTLMSNCQMIEDWLLCASFMQ